MAFDLTEGKKLIHTVLGYGIAIRPGMNFLLEFCARAADNTVWKRIAGLDFEKDADALQTWLNKTLSLSPPSADIRVLWFGIYHPVLNDGETSCSLYLSGSPRIDLGDTAASWAALKEDSYLPAGAYPQSAILDQLYYLSLQAGVQELGEEILCLGYTCQVVKAGLQRLNPQVLQGQAGPRLVAVGFEQGNHLFIERSHSQTSLG